MGNVRCWTCKFCHQVLDIDPVLPVGVLLLLHRRFWNLRYPTRFFFKNYFHVTAPNQPLHPLENRCFSQMLKMTISPDLQRYHWNLNLIKNVEDVEKCLFLFLHCFLKTKDFRRETSTEYEQFKETKTLIYFYLIMGKDIARCKSSIIIFAWRITWNYNPLKRSSFLVSK